jgi:multicomponent Na+:H+ antiporter subunit B
MMNSVILQTTTQFLTSLLLLFSLFLLLRGHHLPGGGFVGGLVAGAALGLYALAYGAKEARRALLVDPRLFIALGLLTALASGLVSLAREPVYLAGRWVQAQLPFAGNLEIGTPLIFDIGVYLVVCGVTWTILFALAED